MEPEGSLPHSQAHATCPYPELAPSSPHTPTSHFPKIHPNIILPSTPGSPQWSPYLRFPHQNPVHTSFNNIQTKFCLRVVTWVQLYLYFAVFYYNFSNTFSTEQVSKLWSADCEFRSICLWKWHNIRINS